MSGSAIVRVDDIIRVHARNLASEPALTCGEVRLTYRELDEYVSQISAALHAAGVGHGDRIAVLGKNSLPYFGLYFATARIGAIMVPLNYWNRVAQHVDVLADVTPHLFFHDPEYAEAAQAAITDAAVDAAVVELEPWGVGPVEGSEWQQFLSAASSTPPESAWPDVSPDDPHMILFTSGTTGRSKGAILTHERTVSDAFSMAAVLGVRQSDVYGNWFTPFHVGNWDHQKFFLIMGAHVVLYPQFDPKVVLDAIQRHRVTVMLTVPIMIQQVMDHPDFGRTDTSSLRLIYFGAYDPSGIMDRAADTFGARRGEVEMLHTYGLTEGGCIVTACPADRMFEKWGSVGRPIPGVEVRLVDEGRDVAVGEPGEILVRGPRMAGYWNRAAESAQALADGWLHTGDVAVSDAQGFLRIVDRKKDMIRSGGQNVYSKEVEDCLATHPQVREVAVIGLPDPVYEEAVCAVVVRRDPGGADDLATQLAEYVRARLAGYNTPRKVFLVDELPKNSLGKILKPELRRSYGSMFDVQS